MAPNTLVLHDILRASDAQDRAPDHLFSAPNGPVLGPNDSISLKGTTKIKSNVLRLGFGREIWVLVIPMHLAEENYPG